MSTPPEDLEPEERQIYELWGSVRQQLEPLLPEFIERVVGQTRQLKQDPRFEAPSLWQVLSAGATQLLNLLTGSMGSPDQESPEQDPAPPAPKTSEDDDDDDGAMG